MYRLYVVPMEATATNGATMVGPKYFSGTTPDGPWACMNYGALPIAFVYADVGTTKHAEINAQPDAVAFPADLGNNVSAAALDTVRQELRDRHLPSGWVGTNTTYREIVRTLAGVFLLAQRFHGITGNSIFQGGYTLNSQLSDIPAGARSNLSLAANQLGWDVSGFTGSDTIRDVLEFIRQERGNVPVAIGTLI